MLQRLFILFLLVCFFSIGLGQEVDSLSNELPGVIYDKTIQ